MPELLPPPPPPGPPGPGPGPVPGPGPPGPSGPGPGTAAASCNGCSCRMGTASRPLHRHLQSRSCQRHQRLQTWTTLAPPPTLPSRFLPQPARLAQGSWPKARLQNFVLQV
eukprot:3947996-Alexandrium_andersonii.AAC.1